MSETIANLPLLFGLIAATIHVLSGPDHLAAIGPLALNTRFRPWIIGMSWGFGHLIGMLLLGMLFIYFKELIPFDYISKNSEKLVGFLLILIGIWAFFRMYLFNKKSKHTHIHRHKDNEGQYFLHYHSHDHAQSQKHHHPHEIEKKTYLAALGIGIIHGLAGFSHILSILPTLAFPSRYQSVMYLTGFGIGTVVAMIAFSFVLGLIGKYSSEKKKDTAYLIVNGIAGTAAVFVGIFWLWSNY
ncbi:MAG: nickel transporter [Chlorobi bacterium]|nr:nickel transporter [Chlorobiota bacterium]